MARPLACVVVRPPRTTALLAVLALFGAGCANSVVTLELPEMAAVPRHPPEQTFVYDAEGNQLAVLRREFRERVPLDDIPEVVVDAVVAAEDQRFHEHGGLDARAIVRAALRNVAAGEIEQGGSTLTQQLVKNLYLPDAPRSPETKLKEAILARQLEKAQGKDWILEEYLNTVYFGSGAYGIQAAAQTYWRIDAADLDLAKAALLAAVIRAPSTLDPQQAAAAARERRDRVLDTMVALGTTPAEAAERARQQPVDVLPRPSTPEALEPHWVDYVVRTLLDDPSFGATEAERAARLYGGGLRIHTTLRPDLQAAARAAITGHLPGAEDPDAAVVTVEPSTGHVLAAASDLPYGELQFDLSTQGRRQPGSIFKTFVLTSAVATGWRPGDLVNGSAVRLDTPSGPWSVRNYGGASYGLLTLAAATRSSVNGAYARLVLDVGPDRVAALARAMGVTSPVDETAPIALGGLTDCCTPLDMAAAYGTLANLGAHVPTTPVARIEDRDGNVVWRPSDTPLPVVEPGVAFVTTSLLREVVERGTGVRAAIPGWEVAGKTGTVTDNVDAWFVGYTPTLSTAVWVGHHEGRIPLRNVRGVRRVTGGTIPAELWRDYMIEALADQEPVPFTLPEEHTVTVEIDPATGLLAAPWCPGEPTELPRPLVPRDACPSPRPEPSPTPSPSPSTEPPCPSPQPESTPSPSPGGSAEACAPPTDAPSPDPPGPSPNPSPSPTPSPTDGG